MNRERIQKVISNMKHEKLSCILVSDPISIFYLTGRMIHAGERMLALSILEDGRLELFVNRLFPQEPEAGLSIIAFDDTDDCIALLADTLPAGKIGIDKNWPSRFTLRLMELRPDIWPVQGSAPVDNARMLKSSDEANAIRVSSQINDEALQRTIDSIQRGDTERALGRRYVEFGKKLGASDVSFGALICFGANGAEPHHETDETILKEGDSIILDVGLNVNGAMSDMTRTVFCGQPTEEQIEVYELVKAANEAGRRAVQPGVPLSEIDRAAREVIEKGGYGKYFIHRTGHGIGLEVHEPPDVSASNSLPAQPGMIFSIEPGIYLPGRFGVRIEDLVLVTRDGSETLNSLPRDRISL